MNFMTVFQTIKEFSIKAKSIVTFVGLIYVFLIFRVICDPIDKEVITTSDDDIKSDNPFAQFGKEGSVDNA